MSQDIIADGLNQIRNARMARKDSVTVKRFSSLFIEVLKIMKQLNYVKGYRVNTKEKNIEISLGEIAECRAIKPRFNVKSNNIDRYLRRYLPARDYGVVIISTNEGLITHQEAIEKNIGGSLIAYVY